MSPVLVVLTVGGAIAGAGVFVLLRWLFQDIDRHVGVIALVSATLGVVVWVVAEHGVLPLLVGAPPLLATLVWLGARRTRSAATVTRWGDRTRRRKGVATTFDILRFASARAMRSQARILRPSMRGLTRRQLRKVRVQEFATELCRTARMRVWASVRDVIAVFGGPGAGKTGWLAARVIDHSGAVITTSTRTDLMDLTRSARSSGERPVWVFNPGGLGGLESTMTFNPLTGCGDPTVATERAADMIPEAEGDDGDRNWWDTQARDVLAALMHAAAQRPNGTGEMDDVLRWVVDPTGSEAEIYILLGRSPQPSYKKSVAQWIHTADKTRDGISTAIMPALRWLTSATAVAATKGGVPFDVAELLRTRGAVYCLGRHEAHTAPLLAALNGYIIREARRLAAHQPGGRLDPPLGVMLDEAARVAPIPLPDISGDAGGSGIHLVVAFQSRADLLDRWGKTGAAKILNNSGSVMLFGGTKDPEDLDAWSKLAGDRDEPVKTRDKHGKTTSTTVRKTPVLSAAQLSNLPKFRVVVFSRGMAPVVGRAQMVWEHGPLVRVARWVVGVYRRISQWVPVEVVSQRPGAQVPPALPAPSRPTPTVPSPAHPSPALAGVGGRPVVKEHADVSH